VLTPSEPRTLERADPADPGGMGSTGPAIEDGFRVTLGHQRGRTTCTNG
jgi:hypothetical protein